MTCPGPMRRALSSPLAARRQRSPFPAAAGALGILLVCLARHDAAAAPVADAHRDFFESQVRPLLHSACGECHGPSEQWSGLRVDSRAALLAGGDRGPAVVPGDAEHSRLIEAVRRTGELEMPPDEPLAADQIAILEQWISLGAPWPDEDLPPSAADAQLRQHWAFQPVQQPQLPAVAHDAWGRTPIDCFVLAKLEAAGLAPAPPADRRTLVRRATYDLTGLPPTPEEVQAFVDDADPAAYERLVDRLLASPHYGEHWGRHWLDVARYSDTKGYVYAREERYFVHAYPYRDWVVNAFNEDLPYDRFLLLQLAADQAAPEDRPALAAMGFLTLGRRFLGVTHDIYDDRIDVVSRGLLGLTVACARCHDHKYDPIPTADYYALYGVFQNCTERMVAISEGAVDEPGYAEFAAELRKREDALQTGMAAAREETAARARGRIADYLVAQTELEKYPDENFDQVFSKADLLPAYVRRWQNYLDRAARAGDAVFLPWRRFSSLPPAQFAAQAPAITEQLAKAPAEVVHPLVAQSFSSPPASISEVARRYGEIFAGVDRQWQDLKAASPDAASLADPAAEQLRLILYAPSSPCVPPDESVVSNERFFDTDVINNLWKLQGEVDRWIINSQLSPRYAVALCDRDLIEEPRIFRRGNPLNRGEPIPRQFLNVLAGEQRQPFARGSGRLELAQAIASPDNPLTARVWVNRVWQHHFGAGLVDTPSDFGLRAVPPSHPQLLDWLAHRFVASGWRTKDLHRLIMLSAVYQQASSPPAEAQLAVSARQVDPDNRLLSHMNIRRLSFEEWRDTLLAASGELDLALGGRPAELFKPGVENRRRTLYGLIDRQFLDGAMRMFDFANPDLHTPQRSETTVAQQSLFALNHPFVAGRAQALAARLDAEPVGDAERVARLYRWIYQRQPTAGQLEAALIFISAQIGAPPVVPPEQLAWQYGYGQFRKEDSHVEFTPLPHFTGQVWQGSPKYPDEALGWVQLSAAGGHPGNDEAHAAIRRWTAAAVGNVKIASVVRHEETAGDGVRCRIVSSRHGLLCEAVLHHQTESLNVAPIDLQPGDTVDFIVDRYNELNSDQYLWSVDVEQTSPAPASADHPRAWSSSSNFAGPQPKLLTPWQQLAQVLLLANELMFID
ncbi:MAG: PSD1 domain-containing protein [Pirellulales bacterium]|nr:PSD1 domain-containing protein [Pirellulales bacterium]